MLIFKEIEIFNNLFTLNLHLILLFIIIVNVVATSSVITRFLSLSLLLLRQNTI